MQKSMNTGAEDLIRFLQKRRERANQNGLAGDYMFPSLVNVDFPSSNDHAQ